MVQLSKGHKWAVALYFVLLFCFLVIRAYSVPLLPDEAFTYFLYVEPATFFAPTAQVDANNHVLNSVLSFFSVGLFGHSTFALRIPSLLFAVLYFRASFRLAKNLPDKVSFWLTIIALNSIYPVLEFHSLSRGYGMSYALLLMGTVLIFDFQKHKTTQTIWQLLVVVTLGLFAQLSLLFAFSGMLFFITFSMLRENTLSRRSKTIFTILFAVLLLTFTFHIQDLKSAGLFYFGTTEGFPLSTVVSLNELLYKIYTNNFGMVMIGVFCIPLLYLLFRLFKNSQPIQQDQTIIFPFVLASSIGGTVISVGLLDAHGPLSRTALYFFILLIASLMFMYTSKNKGIILKMLALALAVFTLSIVNMHNVNYWSNHAVQPAIYKTLLADTNQYKSIGGSDYMDRIFSAEHTIFGSGLATNYVIQRHQFLETDYLLLTQNDIPKWTSELKEYEKLITDTVGVSLFRKKHKQQRIPLDNVSFSFENGSSEYFGVGSYYADSTLPTNLAGLEVSMSSVFPKRNADISWVVSFFDHENEHLESRYYRLNQFSRNWNNGQAYSFSLSIPAIPKETYEMRMFVYNPRLQPHETVDVQYKIVVNDE